MAPRTRAVAIRRRTRSRPWRRYHKKSFTLPVAALLGFAPLFAMTWRNFKLGGIQEAALVATRSMTGFDMHTGGWHPAHLTWGLYPALLGLAVHKFIGGTLGVNRMLGGAGIPIIRL